MKPETANSKGGNHEKEESHPAWFSTFSFLGDSGAISSSQLRRLVAPVKKLWRKLFGKAA